MAENNTLVENSDIQFDDSEFDPKEEAVGLNSTTDDIPKELRILRTQAYDKSISDVIGMIDEMDLVLDPEYQRNYIWDNKRASLLVESVLLNVPLPVFYVAEDEDSKWDVVDGLQRLHSLHRFFKDDFKLRGLEVLTDLNGSTYTSLNPKATRILRNGILRIILILKESHPEIKYEIFMRLNRGSVKLTEQELRNCLYRGKLNNLLKELRENPTFQKLLGQSMPDKRFGDAELVLRYLMISSTYDIQSGEIKGYNGKMKSALNRYFEDNRNPSDEELAQIRGTFVATVAKVDRVFGPLAFKRLHETGTYENRINRAIMDYEMVSFERYDIEGLEERKDAIINLARSLPKADSKFYLSILLSTSDTSSIEYRLNTWCRQLDQLMSE